MSPTDVDATGVGSKFSAKRLNIRGWTLGQWAVRVRFSFDI